MEKETATHSNILTWKISWTEEPGGLQSMGSQRVRHDLAIKQPPSPGTAGPLSGSDPAGAQDPAALYPP